MVDEDLLTYAEGRIGTVLCGKYTIDRVIGVGGMAVVYAATHRNQKRVAIKMLLPGLSVRQNVRARFLSEGYAANTVDHPGAVSVLDDDTTADGAAFLVMELLVGGDVERLWEEQGRRLDARVVLAIADQVLGALQAAHAKSIVHRDIKPANLYVTHDGSLKVLDFGIARVRDATTDGRRATQTGQTLGTPAYMAPEQARGKPSEVDGTTDLWSVGATMFALLSGDLVHDGETATEVLVQTATQPARSLSEVAPDADPRVVAIVDRALAFDKAARWPSATAMRQAVNEAHLAMFGAKVSKEPLERLVAATTAFASTVAEPSVVSPAASSSRVGAAYPASFATRAAASSSRAGPTTAQPVIAGGETGEVPAPRSAKIARFLLPAGVTAAIVACIAIAGWPKARAVSATPAAAAAPSDAPPPSDPPLSAEVLPPADPGSSHAGRHGSVPRLADGAQTFTNPIAPSSPDGTRPPGGTSSPPPAAPPQGAPPPVAPPPAPPPPSFVQPPADPSPPAGPQAQPPVPVEPSPDSPPRAVPPTFVPLPSPRPLPPAVPPPAVPPPAFAPPPLHRSPPLAVPSPVVPPPVMHPQAPMVPPPLVPAPNAPHPHVAPPAVPIPNPHPPGAPPPRAPVALPAGHPAVPAPVPALPPCKQVCPKPSDCKVRCKP
jgi:eukaryotic-like serine/threonine-protein kinase